MPGIIIDQCVIVRRAGTQEPLVIAIRYIYWSKILTNPEKSAGICILLIVKRKLGGITIVIN